jgi:hypothetical protein
MVVLAGLTMGLVIVNVVFLLLALVALIVLTVRFGYFFALVACFSAVIFCSLCYDIYMAVAFVLLVVSPGIIMGYKARSFSPPHEVLLWGMVPYMLPMIFLILLYPDLTSHVPTIVETMKSQLTDNAGFLNLGGTNAQQIFSSLETTVYWTIRLAPGIFLTLFTAMVVFSYLGATLSGPYFGGILPRFKPVFLWKASELWLILLGLSLISVLLGGNWLKIIGENLLVFLIHLYAFFGICLVEFYLRSFKITGWIRIIIYLFLLVTLIIAIPILAVIGLIDSRFNFRKVSHFADKSYK